MNSENELLAELLYGHLAGFVQRLRQIPADRWDFTFAPPAPTPRILVVHAWQWLRCDRQHIFEPDALQHSDVPEPPEDQQAMCDALLAEAEIWRDMILKLTPEEMNAPRRQFNTEHALTVRWFLGHMLQNCIYKHGQFSTIFFALGLDGTEPYDAPFPNPIYKHIREQGSR